MKKIEVPRRYAIWAILGVCVLSAAIGAGVALLARTGPSGPRGARGPHGARGPVGRVDTAALQAEIETLREESASGELEEVVHENEERIEELEEDLSNAERTTSELCGAVEFVC